MRDITNNTPTKENTMIGTHGMTIMQTNKSGDYNLVRNQAGQLTIRTQAGTILVQGKFSYVLKTWETFKNT
jgi:hypothetical protein